MKTSATELYTIINNFRLSNPKYFKNPSELPVLLIDDENNSILEISDKDFENIFKDIYIKDKKFLNIISTEEFENKYYSLDEIVFDDINNIESYYEENESLKVIKTTLKDKNNQFTIKKYVIYNSNTYKNEYDDLFDSEEEAKQFLINKLKETTGN